LCVSIPTAPFLVRLHYFSIPLLSQREEGWLYKTFSFPLASYNDFIINKFFNPDQGVLADEKEFSLIAE
jgi:hypothetical protein